MSETEKRTLAFLNGLVRGSIAIRIHPDVATFGASGPADILELFHAATLCVQTGPSSFVIDGRMDIRITSRAISIEGLLP